MKEYLITGNVVERKNQFDNSEPIKGFIVGDKIIYQNGWDILDRVEHLIVKIYKAPITNNSSWCFSSITGGPNPLFEKPGDDLWIGVKG